MVKTRGEATTRFVPAHRQYNREKHPFKSIVRNEEKGNRRLLPKRKEKEAVAR